MAPCLLDISSCPDDGAVSLTLNRAVSKISWVRGHLHIPVTKDGIKVKFKGIKRSIVMRRNQEGSDTGL